MARAGAACASAPSDGAATAAACPRRTSAPMPNAAGRVARATHAMSMPSRTPPPWRPPAWGQAAPTSPSARACLGGRAPMPSARRSRAPPTARDKAAADTMACAYVAADGVAWTARCRRARKRRLGRASAGRRARRAARACASATPSPSLTADARAFRGIRAGRVRSRKAAQEGAVGMATAPRLACARAATAGPEATARCAAATVGAAATAVAKVARAPASLVGKASAATVDRALQAVTAMASAYRVAHANAATAGTATTAARTVAAPTIAWHTSGAGGASARRACAHALTASSATVVARRMWPWSWPPPPPAWRCPRSVRRAYAVSMVRAASASVRATRGGAVIAASFSRAALHPRARWSVHAGNMAHASKGSADATRASA